MYLFIISQSQNCNVFSQNIERLVIEKKNQSKVNPLLRLRFNGPIYLFGGCWNELTGLVGPLFVEVEVASISLFSLADAGNWPV